MSENLADDFLGVLNANFDANLQLMASKGPSNSQDKKNIDINKAIANQNLQILIDQLYKYKNELDKTIGSLVAEKTKTLPTTMEPLPLEKQKIIIRSGIIKESISELECEIRDLKKENAELEAIISQF